MNKNPKALNKKKASLIAKVAVILMLNLFASALASAQEDINLLRSNAQNAQTDSQKLDAYKNLYRYFEFSNNDSAIYYSQQGLSYFTSDNYQIGKASMLIMIAGIYGSEGLFDIAKQKDEEALEIFTGINNKPGIANAHNSLGVIEGRKSNYAGATHHFIIALETFESIRDSDGIISTYVKLGLANEFVKDYAKALEYYNAALTFSTNKGRLNNTIFLYNNIGSIYCRKGAFDTAMRYLQKTLDLSEGPKYSQIRILPLMNMGNIYRERGDYAKALDYYQQALNLAGKEKQSENYIQLLLNIALMTAKKDPGKAMATLDEALETTKKTGQKTLQADVIDGMIEVSTEKNDYKHAFDLLLRKQGLLDSIYDIKKAKEIANLQAVHDLTKSNEQITALKESEQKNEKKRDIIIVIALFLGASVVSVFYLYRSSTKLNMQLAKRKDELKNANDVKDKLFSIIGHDLNSAILNMPVLLELYRNETTTEEEKTLMIDSLEESALVSSEILENLLNWGKSQIKGITLNQTYFEASEIIQNKIRLMNIAVRNKNITVVNNTPAATKVYADINHFTFVVRNLLSNAIKYTRTNGIIEIGADQAFDSGYVVFSIKDNGIGISSEHQQNIFAPFNVSARGTANEAGNSIGLLLCKEFVTANGGKIWVESEDGKGATFYFSFKSKP